MRKAIRMAIPNQIRFLSNKLLMMGMLSLNDENPNGIPSLLMGEGKGGGEQGEIPPTSILPRKGGGYD
jgi:hypothetical protein